MEVSRIKKKLFWIIISAFLILIFIWGLIFRPVLPSLWNFLVVNEEPKPADVIIILSGDKARAEYGIRLYKQGYAGMLLFTGSEAQRMRKQAISSGIEEDHILIEDKSNSTFGNANNSSEIMRDQGYKSALVITSPYHTRRSSIIFDHFSEGLDLTICSIPYNSSIAKNWWKNRSATRSVVTEYMKLIWHYLVERPFGLFERIS